MLKKLRSFELQLLDLTTLPEIIDFILKELVVVFDLDDISLSLVNQDNEISNYLASYDYDYEKNANLILLEDKIILVNNFSNGMYMGAYEAYKHEVFFPLREETPATIAIMPLTRKGHYLGSLNLVSKRADCFFNSFINDSMPQLVALLAMTIENSLQFETLKQVKLIETLTHVNNRHFFERRLVEELDRGQRSVNYISCLIFDVIFSKGRKNTDAQKLEKYVLESISELLKQQLRVSDVFSYYEGKKFAALLVNVSDEVVVALSKRIQAVLKEHKIIFLGQTISFSAAIGHASYEFDRDSSSQIQQEIAVKLIDEADTHLQKIKQT
ncbi:MAG: sensor domain-containing diguanylate cyclase [Methylococcales bacterium]|nr:sensor domain-containing diguanylate cyclase [Methylococcales bacterium]